MSSFDLPSPDAFTTGTVGPAGQRVFYLQARDGELVVTVRCEKQQVAALADYLDGSSRTWSRRPTAWRRATST